MANNLFAIPEWDNDVPSSKFNFNENRKKKLNSKNKKIIINQSEDNEPGKYVRINKNAAINLINEQTQSNNINIKKSKKRKITKDNNNDAVGGDRKDEENEQSSLIKKRKLSNQNSTTTTTTTASTSDNDGNNLHLKHGKKGLKLNKLKVKEGKKQLGVGHEQQNDISADIKKQQKNEKVSSTDGGTAVDSFRNKLIGNLAGSRFRYLNEQLYSSDGSSAVELFKNDADAFQAYHEGYRRQVEQWPLNPLDRIIKAVRKLPSSYVVADFGCGDGRLAKSIPNKTYSLDLVANRPDIIACNMASTPLETNSIDVAVFCLSLMGTNLKDFLLEANRVLKNSGQLKIAEVESRFSDIKQFIENVKWCGFQLINQDLTNKLFLFLNFKKIKQIDKKHNKIREFSLKPCLYKKR